MATYIYKRFPYPKHRSIPTMLFSSYWHSGHSIKVGYYLSILGTLVLFALEDLYTEVIRCKNASKLRQAVENVILWSLKTFFISYLVVAFMLRDFDKIWRYYHSIYHFGYVLIIVLHVTCLVLKKIRRKVD